MQKDGNVRSVPTHKRVMCQILSHFSLVQIQVEPKEQTQNNALTLALHLKQFHFLAIEK